MNLMNGKPVKAFYYQDHEAHLQVHMMAMQDPKIMQIVGQNPQAQTIMAAGAAHVMEHVAFQYRKEIEKQLGANLPPMPDAEKDENYLPEAAEVQVSQLAAAAAAKLLQKDKAEVQAAQAQQQAQDPIIQMQQMELQLRAQELQIQQQKLQLDAQTKQAQLQLDSQIKMAEEQRKQQEMQINAAQKADEIELRQLEISNRQQIEAAKMGANIQKHKAELSARQQAEGVRMGIDIAKAKEASEIQRNRPQKGKKE
jgi:hypothetical protein